MQLTQKGLFLSILLALLTVEVCPAQPADQHRVSQGQRFDVPDSVILERDIEYGRVADYSLKLDFARPRKSQAEPLPLIVYIHGGGWMSGSKSNAWRRGYLTFAASAKYAVASVDYRLSRVATWPACIHDCKAAIRWLKANAEKYNIDPARVAVCGISAGGHLVALLATTADVRELEGTLGNLDQSSRVTCGVDESGPTDFTAYANFDRHYGNLRSPREPDSPEYRLFGGALKDHSSQMRAASPTTYASKHASPLLIVHGTEDSCVPIGQAELLYNALKIAGADATYIRLDGIGHAVNHPEYHRRRDLFLAKYLLGADVTVESGTIGR